MWTLIDARDVMLSHSLRHGADRILGHLRSGLTDRAQLVNGIIYQISHLHW